MTRLNRWLLAAVLVLGLGVRAQAVVDWQLVSNSDCTALGTATGLSATAIVNCCTGVRTGYCDKRGTAMGTEFARIVYGISTTTGAYTTTGGGGDFISAQQMNKLGMKELVYATCNPTQSPTAAQTGLSPILVRTSTTPKIRLFNGTTELTAVSVQHTVFNCLIIGH